MLWGTYKQTDRGCTSCLTSMMSLRSQPLSNASLLKNKTREQHECTNLMHSDLALGSPKRHGAPPRPPATIAAWFARMRCGPGDGCGPRSRRVRRPPPSPEKFEVKRLGPLEHSNDALVVSSG